jgi:predicted nuclease of restriction endonuclease-like (RecB) superfamily
MKKTKSAAKAKALGPQTDKLMRSRNSSRLLGDIRSYIEETRQTVAVAANAGLVSLYWKIGRRIHQDILKEQRADYGQQIVYALGRQLTQDFGPGFSDKNLRHMVRFVETFSEPEIVYALSRQLSWTHFRQIIYLDDQLKRDFYAELCRVENWSTRTLHQKIQGLLFERTALSKKPQQLIQSELAALRENDKMSPDLVFRDPYFLDFLGLKDAYSEQDMEAAILRELENFILELGSGFAFVARQKRITVDDQDYYLDLLFYHRPLRRLVALELKLEKFQAADKGQMELYLRWLQKHERGPGEGAPIGLILCAEKTSEHVELLELEKSGIRIAQYLTALPPRKTLTKKLHQAIQSARRRLASGEESPAPKRISAGRTPEKKKQSYKVIKGGGK